MRVGKDQSTAPDRATTVRRRLVAYLIVAFVWWGLARFVISVRVESMLWLPVFDVFFSQALVFEAAVPSKLLGMTRVIWLGTYLGLAVAAWSLLERKGARSEIFLWRRAILSSLVWQAILVVVGYGVGE